MGQIIKSFADGSYLEYDRGNFDEWCVYLTRGNGRRSPPRDTDYFHALKRLADLYGANRIYAGYVRVYNLTGNRVEASALSEITAIASAYGKDSLEVDVIFSILYMAMIAEEKKEFTRLGKRIKRLGIYELLIKNRSVGDAANFMRGMGWREIDRLCKEYGF